MILKNFSSLKTTIQKSVSSSLSSEKRKKNIEWIKGLNRKNLSFQVNEKSILLYTTEKKEDILIKFPGKESRINKKNGERRDDSTIKPWDFRPKLYNNIQNKFMKDLSFSHIWDIIINLLNTTNKEKLFIAKILAISFYRMAFMLDHHKNKKPNKFIVYYHDYSKKDEFLNKTTTEIFPEFCMYSPKKCILNRFRNVDICVDELNISLEAFLFYNELLAWNEDCKYFYRNVNFKQNEWLKDTGRVNTLLSHISVIGFLLNKIKLSELIIDFVRHRGTAPAKNTLIFDICSDFIENYSRINKKYSVKENSLFDFN